jgi:hypothetical protein
MTDERFDDLTRRLESATSRRGVLKGAAAVALGGIAMRFRTNGADARARIKMACARPGQACSTATNAADGLRCCPHLVCDAPDDETIGECVPEDALCAPGEIAEVCAELIMSSCGEISDNCAQATNVDGGCACVARTCTEIPCSSGADCQSGLCVSVPGCCDSPLTDYSFCAVPCGENTFATQGARVRRAGGWSH